MQLSYDADRLALLQEAHLPFRATGRFGIDALLEKDNLDKIDAHEIYVAESDLQRWKAHFANEGVKEVDVCPNLRVYVVHKLPKASRPIIGALEGQVVDFDTLAEDARLMCPRYIESKLPELSAFPALTQRITAAGPL